jgi:hypothetical protein
MLISFGDGNAECFEFATTVTTTTTTATLRNVHTLLKRLMYHHISSHFSADNFAIQMIS